MPLQELRKAIINKQQFILLEDGSLGMLPGEWISKYATLMRMGQVKEGVLQLPATNWTLVDQLQDQFNDTALQARLEDRKRRLQNIDSVATHPVPAAINASLRDYQQAGFQWMCLLDELGWGGCLADDMGLGKTLQTICFLQWLSDKYPHETRYLKVFNCNCAPVTIRPNGANSRTAARQMSGRDHVPRSDCKES